MSKAKIGIICLTTRRNALLYTHVKQLSKCKYRNFHIYILGENLTDDIKKFVKTHLPENSTIIDDFQPGNYNYIQKINYGLNTNHEFSIKMDEDCILLSESWDKFFNTVEKMNENDLFCTGAISNGIPTCDYFIKNFIPNYQEILNNIFSFTKFNYHAGVNYSSLNAIQETQIGNWNPKKFYEGVKKINHYYKGIHPVRVNFIATKTINDAIFLDIESSMKPKNCEIIKSKEYPYFCNNIFGIRTSDWKYIISRRDLFVDVFDEVPLNLFLKESNKNMVIDTGIPILHTLYNWCGNSDYENKLVEQINDKLQNV